MRHRPIHSLPAIKQGVTIHHLSPWTPPPLPMRQLLASTGVGQGDRVH
jgi:hypothetical protein